MEIAAREREMQRLQCIPKKWNRREEYEFLRVLTGYGIDVQPASALTPGVTTVVPDWTKFKQMAHLERKSDETLSDYYKVFISMCKRQAGVKLAENEKGLEGIIEDISEDHAKLILDRLELFSKLREISKHPQLEERLKLCMANADTPDWWEPGKHDKELIMAVLKHGLYRSKTFIFNDHTFTFADSEKRFLRELETQMEHSLKLEALNAEKLAATPSTAANLKDEIIDLDEELLTKDSLIKKENFSPVKTESLHNEIKDEILKTEEANETGDSVAVKAIKECDDNQDLTKEEDSEVLTKSKKSGETEIENKKTDKEMESNENSDENDDGKETNEEEKEEATNEKSDKSVSDAKGFVIEDGNKSKSKDLSAKEDTTTKTMEDNQAPQAESEKADNNKKEATSDESNENLPDGTSKELSDNKKEDDETKPSKAVDEDMLDLTSATGGSNDPDDEEVMKEKEKAVEEECKKQAAELKARFPDLEVIQPGAAKQKQEKIKLEISISWFKDFALERRIYHIVACIETGKWPVDKSYSAMVGCKGIELNIGLHEAIPHLSVVVEKRSATPDVITITTEQGVTKHLPTSQVQQAVAPVAIVTAAPVVSTTVSVAPINTTCTSSKSSSLSLTSPSVTQISTSAAPTAAPPAPPVSTTSPAAAAAAAAAAAGLSGLDANSFNAAMAAAVAAAGGNANALSALLPGMSLTSLPGLNIPNSNSSAVGSTNTPSTTNSGKKRKRHIAIDVETERAKLHALLNSAQTRKSGLKFIRAYILIFNF